MLHDVFPIFSNISSKLSFLLESISDLQSNNYVAKIKYDMKEKMF